ncbi:MAG: winged helix-turn-helix transcriptional regulator [Asgard group archaeon]|nr:winged helix-turn-helix transcriptional regulator [Asgard group archaeon]
MTIEERDLELLIALQENPLAPASKLAKTVNLSTPTVITKLELLKKDKSYYNVFAHVHPETLDMVTTDVLVEIDSIENTEFFEKEICYKHPYTLFRIRCFGSFNGLFVQFRIPKNSREILLDLFDQLKKKGKIVNYFLPKVDLNSLTVFTNANLANWQAKLMRWNFNWNAWIDKLRKMDSKAIQKPSTESVLSKLDELDIALLQEITMNARQKNTEIMDSLKLNRDTVGLQQKISRKLKFLDKEVISQYRVFLRWETFEIYNSFLVLCECKKEIANKLQNLLNKNPIPFESTYKITENGFLWYLRCPASHFSDVSEIIWGISNKVKFYYLDYKKSQYYGLWKGAFDSSKNNWSTELMKNENIL